MSKVSPTAQALARRVLLHEAGGRAELAALAEAAERADARLRGRLADLIGTTAYTTLVARAVRLAQAEVPALEGVTATGLTTTLAHVIGLLITFIGENLVFRLIHEAWPELAHGQVD